MNQLYETTYSGERYKGNVMMDQLWLAGRLFPQFTFVEIVESSGAGDDREGYDGILGMRRPPENDESCDFLKTTILDYVVNAGIVNDAIFTFRFCGQHGIRGDSWFVHGNLEFGGTRPDYFYPPIVSLPLYQATQWLVDITSIEYGDVVLCNLCRGYVDTGSPDTYAPVAASNKLLEASVVRQHVDGMFHVLPHDLHQVHPLKIKLGHRVYTLLPQQLTRFVSDYLVWCRCLSRTANIFRKFDVVYVFSGLDCWISPFCNTKGCKGQRDGMDPWGVRSATFLLAV
ncbi:hypothetical protein CSKR_104939 [Clonorchis sinensis]|uniref:Peptidase A1 domain-containing protein n=1 Tax=Clonorchis sinensis TaxID=79923 RepID=A0A8T1N060_CLOSI|nr:hypothetical protein CSKR_104939 [Clonorchis sinensis]